jgi:hypothetical protein
MNMQTNQPENENLQQKDNPEENKSKTIQANDFSTAGGDKENVDKEETTNADTENQKPLTPEEKNEEEHKKTTEKFVEKIHKKSDEENSGSD